MFWHLAQPCPINIYSHETLSYVNYFNHPNIASNPTWLSPQEGYNEMNYYLPGATKLLSFINKQKLRLL